MHIILIIHIYNKIEYKLHIYVSIFLSILSITNYIYVYILPCSFSIHADCIVFTYSLFRFVPINNCSRLVL